MTLPAEDIANQIFDVIPLVMRTIRAKFREGRADDLSIVHLRSLAFINRCEGTSLSDVAGHIGLTLPSMSKMVDGLVSRKLLRRELDSGDRRRVSLALTATGRKALQASYEQTEVFLAEKVGSLSESERQTVAEAMQILQKLFALEYETELGFLAREK